MLELARCYETSPVLMSDLAEKENLSIKYLHTLLTRLKSAGLVQSIRGAGGGFILARAPSRIKLNEILHVLEGHLSLVDCVNGPKVCKKSNSCTARRVWAGLSETIDQALAGVTLKDLISSEDATTASKKKSSPQTNKNGPQPAGEFFPNHRPKADKRPQKSKKRSLG